MSFGGAVSAMAASLRNNARKKRKTYFDRDNSHSENKNENRNVLLEKKATLEQLAKIRNSFIKENRRNNIKNVVIILIILVSNIVALLIFNT